MNTIRKKTKIIKEFPIYDMDNKRDPLVQEMEILLKNNPSYEAVPYQQSGPCSNWGFIVYETIEVPVKEKILKINVIGVTGSK